LEKIVAQNYGKQSQPNGILNQILIKYQKDLLMEEKN
jgi:hypothetical protein